MPDTEPTPRTTTSSPTEDASTTGDEAADNYWDYCPNCASRLHNRGCKYRCPKCHYFMSCSDFDQ